MTRVGTVDPLQANLEGRVAVVTGAGRGIGAATARTLAGAGAAVVCGDRLTDELEALVATIKSSGGVAVATPMDVLDPQTVEACVETAMKDFGKLNLAFNNAGVQTEGLLHQISIEEFDRVIGINLRGTFTSLKYEIEAMLNTGGGAIVNTASVGGVIADHSISPYVASKHGVIGITKAAALDYAEDGIRVNSIAPGATDTEMLRTWLNTEEKMGSVVDKTPLGRLADPQEIANAAVFLLSDAASFITGATLFVDGGLVVA